MEKGEDSVVEDDTGSDADDASKRDKKPKEGVLRAE